MAHLEAERHGGPVIIYPLLDALNRERYGFADYNIASGRPPSRVLPRCLRVRLKEEEGSDEMEDDGATAAPLAPQLWIERVADGAVQLGWSTPAGDVRVYGFDLEAANHVTTYDGTEVRTVKPVACHPAGNPWQPRASPHC